MKKVLLILIILSLFIITACDNQTPSDFFSDYKEKWESKDYQGMYQMISSDSKDYISEEDFINRYKNIYDGIGAEEIDINLAQDIFNDEIYSYLRTYKLYPKNKIKLENFKIKLTPEEAMNNSIQIRYLITDINIQREISTYELKGYQIYYRNKIIKERYF